MRAVAGTFAIPVVGGIGFKLRLHSSGLDGKWNIAISKRAFYCWSVRRYGGLWFYSDGLGSLGMDYKSVVVIDMALFVGSSGGSVGGPVGGLAGVVVGAGIGAVWAYKTDF